MRNYFAITPVIFALFSCVPSVGTDPIPPESVKTAEPVTSSPEPSVEPTATPTVKQTHKPAPTESDEPAWCKTLRSSQSEALKELHIFAIPDGEVAVFALGDEDIKKSRAYAVSRGASQESKFCMYYFNEGNEKAEAVFNFHPLTNLKDLTPAEAKVHYRLKAKLAVKSMHACLSRHKFVAFGDNDLKHRVPAVLGMLLVSKGCSVASATEVLKRSFDKKILAPDEVMAAVLDAGKVNE